MKRKQNYTRAVFICHGKSELIFVKNLRSNLKLKVEIEAKQGGKSSIQLTSVINYLDKHGYGCLDSIINNDRFNIETNKKGEPINFKIFIIMDLDEKELTNEMKKNYKNGKMFEKYDYNHLIVPIYNDKNMDEVLNDLGYNIDINKKAESYKKVFPGQNGDINCFKEIKKKFETSKKSNMHEMLEYLYNCLDN